MIRRLLGVLLALLAYSQLLQAQSNALSFDGADDRVLGPVPAAFTDMAATDITVEAWVKLQSTGNFQRVLFAQGSPDQLLSLAVAMDGRVFGYVVKAGTTYSMATDAAIPVGQWTHLAFTWQAATNAVQLYFNGTLQTGNPGGGTSTATSGVLALGARTDGAQPFTGLIDEVRLWNSVRSATAIGADMSTAPALTDAALLAYFPFDQGVAGGPNPGLTTLVNLRNTTLNGTLANFALTGATSNWVGGSDAVLPVELISFAAEPRRNQVLLTWATAMEKNNARYELSRSTDGLHFRPLATVAGGGNTTSRRNYTYTDAAPAPGLNYYKLEQIDQDGTVAQLGIRTASSWAERGQLLAYPNPATDRVSVAVTPGPGQEIQLTDLSGKRYQTLQLTTTQTTATLSLAGLPAGTYLLTLKGPAQVLGTKMVKW